MVANPEMFPWGPWEVSQALIWRLVHMQPDWRRWELSSIRTARYHVERRNNLVQVKSCDGAELESTFVRIQKEVRWRARGNHELRHQRLKARKDFWFYSSIFAFNRTLIFFFFFFFGQSSDVFYGTHPADEANMTTLQNKKKTFSHKGFREKIQEIESNSV